MQVISRSADDARCTVYGMNAAKPTGNWTPEGKAERSALRRDYLELTPSQRVEQVFQLSRFMSEVAEAGRRQRSA